MPETTCPKRPSDIAIRSLDELLDIVCDRAVELRPAINGKSMQPHASGAPFAMMITRDELRGISRGALLTPFKTNVDQWDQGYDVGRTTGEEAGRESAVEMFERFADSLRVANEQFRVGAPFTAHYVGSGDSRVVDNAGNWIIRCGYESDAQALADLLNLATTSEAREVSHV